MRRPLVLQFADEHHAFHEDAKPRDLADQLDTRSSAEGIQRQVQDRADSDVDPATH